MAEVPSEAQLEIWSAEFDSRHRVFRDLSAEAERTLKTALTVADTERAVEKSMLKVHDIQSRVKVRKSFRDKIVRKCYR